jgi:chemotaxis protein methyltransferase CheR
MILEPATVSVPDLGEAEFRALGELIYTLAGIRLGPSKKALVASRLAKRLRALRLPAYADYLRLLSSPEGSVEIPTFINCITTNKTEFFREAHHFDVLAGEVFPELRRRAAQGGSRRVRIWSSAASTGEEPYTIAMTVLEHFGPRAGWDIKILASDIDTEVLRRCEEGIYTADRLDDVPEALRARYFLRGTGEWAGRYRVKPELRELLTFRRVNLIEPSWPFRGMFDVIFCRNVVIYFDRPTQERLFRRFSDVLHRDGWLIVGHSENLHWLGDLFEAKKGTVYRPKSAGSAVPAAATTRAPVAAAEKTAAPSPRRSSSTFVTDQKIHIGGVFAGSGEIVRTLLGSCVSACIWDPKARVGGMNHILLPAGGGREEGCTRFGVNAMEVLINEIMKRGGDRRRLRAKVFGGARVLNLGAAAGNVAGSNVNFVRGFLVNEGIPIEAERTGGTSPLEVRFWTDSGRSEVRPVGSAAQSDVQREEADYVARVSREIEKPREDSVTLF